MDGAALGAVAEDWVRRSSGIQVTATAFAALFSVVGLALYGLPLYYDFMVRELGWSRTMVTSGNALSKLVVGPLFGFGAGWIVDRFGRHGRHFECRWRRLVRRFRIVRNGADDNTRESGRKAPRFVLTCAKYFSSAG